MEPMKATGIVRRIDELGRVVIPKEIRRTQRIRRGDPLEIFTTGDGEVIFKKYSPIGELQGVAMQYAEVLLKRNKNLENDWLIGDESWREGNKNTFEIRLTYYADADDAKEGRESEYQYKIHFDDVDGYVIKSEGVPEKEIVFPENK